MPRFPKAARLLRPAEFALVRAAGISVTTPVLKISVKPSDEQRLGLITSRRLGTAVVRNRLRRMIREHFRLERRRYPKADCVVIPFSKAKELSNAELREALNEALLVMDKRLRKAAA